MKAPATAVALVGTFLGACAGDPPPIGEAGAESARATSAPITLIDPASGPGAMAPRLTPGLEGALLTWLQPVDTAQSEELRLMVSELDQGAWNAATQIVQGDAFFANWADLPAAVEGSDGVRYAHWLEMLGDGTYAYGVQLARSIDGGGTSFAAPIEVDGDKPAGRVGVVLGDTSEAYVSWLGTAGENAEIRLRRVTPGGELGQVRRVATATAKRSSGIPQMVRHGDDLVLAWVDGTQPSRIKAGVVACCE